MDFNTDLSELKGKSYLVVVDYAINFFDITLLPNKESPTAVTHTKRIFSKPGIPEKVVSDNGSEYIKYIRTSNMTHLVLITQNLMETSKPFRQ